MQHPPALITLAEILAFTEYSDNALADAMEIPYVELAELIEKFQNALYVIEWPDDVDAQDYGDTVDSWTFIAEMMTQQSVSMALTNHPGVIMSAAVEDFVGRAVLGGGR